MADQRNHTGASGCRRPPSPAWRPLRPSRPTRQPAGWSIRPAGTDPRHPFDLSACTFAHAQPASASEQSCGPEAPGLCSCGCGDFRRPVEAADTAQRERAPSASAPARLGAALASPCGGRPAASCPRLPAIPAALIERHPCRPQWKRVCLELAPPACGPLGRSHVALRRLSHAPPG